MRVVAAVVKYERDLEPVTSSSKAHDVDEREVLNLELVVILSET